MFQEMIVALTKCYDHVYLTVDGLDECELPERKGILNLLMSFSQLQDSDVRLNLLIASCQERDIEKALQGGYHLELNAYLLNPDIRIYLRIEVKKLGDAWKYSNEEIRDIFEKIASRPKGL